MPNPLVVIVGPTASGKSALAMEVAKKYNGEIICADSRTVYRGMDVGTAKPSTQDRNEVRHHLLDIVEPDQPFNAAEFKQLAIQAIESIHDRNKLPVLVGGTGLYIDAVIFDYQFGPVAEQSKRTELEAMTTVQLIELCKQKNINLPRNHLNRRHLIRALELGGQISHEKNLRDNTLVVGITMNKERLRQRIESRTHEMIRQGVLAETQLLDQTYGWQNESMTANIYRIFKSVISGDKQIESAVGDFVRSDMRLAKRQLTWFRRNPHIVWGVHDELLDHIGYFLKSE